MADGFVLKHVHSISSFLVEIIKTNCMGTYFPKTSYFAFSWGISPLVGVGIGRDDRQEPTAQPTLGQAFLLNR